MLTYVQCSMYDVVLLPPYESRDESIVKIVLL